MNKIYFTSDLHLGHKSILKFQPNRSGTTVDEHNAWIIEQWNSVVTKNDSVWVLGDVAFGEEALKLVVRLRGQKHLVRGNHDTQTTTTYLKYFNNVYGFVKKYGVWMSHAPIHPGSLRGFINLHGHCHNDLVRNEAGEVDPRYYNVGVDWHDGKPICLEEIKQKLGLSVP